MVTHIVRILAQKIITMWRFKFESAPETKGDTFPVNKTVSIVSEEDFKEGFDASYDIPSEISELLQSLGCYEIMEVLYEVDNEDNVRRCLIRNGFIEITDSFRL